MHQTEEFPVTRFWREPKLVGHPDSIFPYSRSTLWKKVGEGTFPAPIKISARVTAWRVDDIKAYIDSLTTGDTCPLPRTATLPATYAVPTPSPSTPPKGEMIHGRE